MKAILESKDITLSEDEDMGDHDDEDCLFRMSVTNDMGSSEKKELVASEEGAVLDSFKKEAAIFVTIEWPSSSFELFNQEITFDEHESYNQTDGLFYFILFCLSLSCNFCIALYCIVLHCIALSCNSFLYLFSATPSVEFSVAGCLETFSKPETLSPEDSWFLSLFSFLYLFLTCFPPHSYIRYCNKCEDHVEASKQVELYSVPENVIIHLKRFSDKFLFFPTQF